MNKKSLNKIFKKFSALKLVYLFGSRAKNDPGPLSDYDFAIYSDGLNKKERFDLKLELLTQLMTQLKCDQIDVVSLNDTNKPELRYDIISEGTLLFEKEPYSLLVEPQILNDYFDFRQTLRMNHLTKA